MMKNIHLGVLAGQRLDYTCAVVHIGELAWNLYWFNQFQGTLCLAIRLVALLLNMIIMRLCVLGHFYSHSRKTMPKTSRLRLVHEAVAILRELVYGVCGLYAFCFPLEKFLLRRFERKQTFQKSIKFRVRYPILFIHGYACNAGFWYPILCYLSKAGISQMYTITLGPQYKDMSFFVSLLSEKVEQIKRETQNEKIIIVGHSMGGLVARAFMKCHEGRSNVVKLVTLQTPHHGTIVGHSLLARIFYGDCVDEMLPGSDFLNKLGKIGESNGNGLIPVVSIFSHHDLIIAPQISSFLEGKNVTNFSFLGLGHLAMPFMPHIQKLILDELVSTQ